MPSVAASSVSQCREGMDESMTYLRAGVLRPKAEADHVEHQRKEKLRSSAGL